jgi:putative transposase
VEVLGLAVGDSEAETSWAEFLRSLRNRGLGGVRLVVSHAHDGLTKAVRRNLKGASWQRCRMRFTRNVLAKVPNASADMVAAALRTVFVHPDPNEVASAWDPVADTFSSQFSKLTDMMNLAKADVLAFSAFPFEHWRKIWSTNPMERVNQEIKIRADVVGILPNDDAVVRLVGAVLAEQHDDRATQRHYLSKGSMAKIRLRAILKTTQRQSSSLSADGTEDHVKAHHSVARHPRPVPTFLLHPSAVRPNYFNSRR